MGNKKVTGFDYLWCALYAFASVAFELLVVAVEGVFGIDMNNFTITQNVVHWLVTIIGWVLLGVLVIHIGKRTTGFDIWERGRKMLPWQYLAIVICFAINIIAKYLDWGGFKVILEWNARGPLLFVFQCIYSLADGSLISLIIVFGQ